MREEKETKEKEERAKAREKDVRELKEERELNLKEKALLPLTDLKDANKEKIY